MKGKDPTEGEGGSVIVSAMNLAKEGRASDGEGCAKDLIGDGLLTGWTLVTGWMVVGVGTGDGSELVEVKIDEELADAPIVPEGFLFRAIYP